MIKLSIENMLIEGEFYSFDFEITEEVFQTVLRNRYFDIVKRRMTAALRADPRGNMQEILNSVINGMTLADLDGPSNDVLEAEALQLAEDHITRELAKDGLPPPKSIRDHAKVLLNSQPALFDEAKRRIMARQQVLRETLPNTLAS